ncbi:MAG TPA: TspO/MBR family protein [Steroidobacteraceae bacterium]|jgi:tryptophan-rich sensory protein|nr:TspO/MBR family protein [Steroidobacteraceae bacterium]
MRIPIESSTSYRGRNSRPNFPALAVFLVLSGSAGALDAVFSPAFSPAAAHWYAALAKPGWLPPQNAFALLWAASHVLMAIAAWIIWRERYHRGRNAGIAAFCIQLALNALWAPMFFGLKSIGAGLFDIVALWLAVGWTMREFARVKAAGAVILVPYFLWVTFATAANLTVWRLNP